MRRGVADARAPARLQRFVRDGVEYVVDVADSGSAGIERAVARRPRVALVDIGLPVMDGYELGRRLRAALPGLRLIALTGYGQQKDKQDAKAAGFDHHLVKPINFDALTALTTRP